MTSASRGLHQLLSNNQSSSSERNPLFGPIVAEVEISEFSFSETLGLEFVPKVKESVAIAVMTMRKVILVFIGLKFLNKLNLR